MRCERCGAALVDDSPCGCGNYQSFLLGALSGLHDVALAPAARSAPPAPPALPVPPSAPTWVPPSAPAWVGPSTPAWVGPPAYAARYGGPGPAAPPLPPWRPPHRWRRPAIALVVIVALFAAGAGTYLRLHPSPGYPSRWDPRIAAIALFVEQERGLKFRHPVAVDFLSVAQFQARVGGGPAPTAKDRVDLEHGVAEMRAVGLIHGDADLAAMDKQLSEQSIIGLYVPHDKQVYVRGTALTPDVRVTLAHELTHALQDQDVDLQRLDTLKGADQSAVRALVEGDAMRVQDAYETTMSAADQASYQATEAAQSSGEDLKGISPVLIDEQSFPYLFGPLFVKALVTSGGTAALDRALAHPPTVDAQIVDPNRYLTEQGVSATPAPRPGPGDKVLDPASPFGQVGTLEVVGAVVGYQAVWPTLSGWQSDSAIGYLHGAQVCMAIASTFDSPADATAFAAVAARWAAGIAGASARPTGSLVELRSCDPGPAVPAVGTAVSPSPFEVLTLRASIMGALFDQVKASADVAACAADRLITVAGPVALSADITNPRDPRVVQVARQLIQALVACGYTGAETPTLG